MENLRLDISLLKLNNKNPRKIEKKSLKELEKSLKKFPEMLEAREIVINKDYEILGGNMRYLAAKNIGIKELPVKIVNWSKQKEKDIVEDDPPILDKENHYSEMGKYYKLGNHLLYCGSFEDATELFKQEKAIACEQTDRKCYGSELSEEYCDVIRKRYWTFVNGSEEGWQKNTPETNLKEVQNA